MRTSMLLVAGAVLMSASVAGKSPVKSSYGFNQALMFTMNSQENNVTSGLATSMTPSPDQTANIIALGGMDLLIPPPVFNHQGNCCRPTPQCHAYFKWIIDTLNSPAQFDSRAQRSEAMAHMACCLRQFRASCEDPPRGRSIIWKDPSKGCSNDPDKKFKLPDGEGDGRDYRDGKKGEEDVKKEQVDDEGKIGQGKLEDGLPNAGGDIGPTLPLQGFGQLPGLEVEAKQALEAVEADDVKLHM